MSLAKHTRHSPWIDRGRLHVELLKQTMLFKAFIFSLANIFFKQFQRNMCFKSQCLDEASPRRTWE